MRHAARRMRPARPPQPDRGGRAGAVSAGEGKLDPKLITWVTELTGAGQAADAKAEQDKKRGKAIKGSTVHLKAGAEDLKGLDFEMLIK